MNTLLSDLQAEAGKYGVRLVGDISTEMTIDLEEFVLLGSLTQVIGTLIRSVPSGSSLSLVTSCELPNDPVNEDPRLSIQIASPSVPDTTDIDADIREMRSCLGPHYSDITIASAEKSWSLSVTLPGVKLPTDQKKAQLAVVVDDDLDTQDFLRAVLEHRGLQVISVSDGFDALLVIERYRPHLVMTDILMPNMNGIELITRIKKAHPDVPVIVFSGFRDTLVNVIAGLPDVILSKPLTRDLILKALAAVLPNP